MIDIEKLALLARIEIDDEEKKKLQTEFEGILGYISNLKEVDVGDEENGEPEIGANELKNVIREDAVTNETRKFSEDLLKEAPAIEGKFVKVRHI